MNQNSAEWRAFSPESWGKLQGNWVQMACWELADKEDTGEPPAPDLPGQPTDTLPLPSPAEGRGPGPKWARGQLRPLPPTKPKNVPMHILSTPAGVAEGRGGKRAGWLQNSNTSGSWSSCNPGRDGLFREKRRSQFLHTIPKTCCWYSEVY